MCTMEMGVANGVKREWQPLGSAMGASDRLQSGCLVVLVFSLSVLLVGCVTTRLHDRSWVEVQTTHYDIVSSLEEEDTTRLAQDIEVVMDGGAYVTLSPVVLSRGIIHAAGPYACDNVRIVGRTMLSNSVPFGAFRGFGAPQTQFAGERHMDVIARMIAMDSWSSKYASILAKRIARSPGFYFESSSRTRMFRKR